MPVILCELDPEDGSLTNKYYYANSQILAQDSAFLADPADPNTFEYSRYIYQHDRLGSVRQVLEVMPVPDIHWRFDESSGDVVYDWRGTGLTDANMVNGVSRITGKYSGGVSFDGIDDYLWTQGDPSDDCSGSHTYTAWIKTTDPNGTILCWGDPNEYGGVLGVYDSPAGSVIGVSVQSVTDGVKGHAIGSTDISDGQWHHIAAVVGENITDANQVIFYIDGVSETISDSTSIAIDTGGYPLVAGSVGYPEYDPNGVLTFTETQVYPWSDPNDPNHPGVYFTGSMDDLRVYNRALSMGQIQKLADNEEYIKVRNTYTYNPYGEDFTAECTETVYNPFKYTGQWYDEEIAQYYLRARMYDPQLMRFTGRDPVKGKFYRPLTLHKYLYCLNDPINKKDPTGRLGGGLVEPIKAATEVHAGAIGVAAYGVSTGDLKFLDLGIALEQMVAPVLAIAMANQWNPIDKMIYNHKRQYWNNSMGNFKLPPGGGKWLAIGITLVALTSVDGCVDDWMEFLNSGDQDEHSPGQDSWESTGN